MKRNTSEIKKQRSETGHTRKFKPVKKYAFLHYHFLFLLIGLFFGLKIVFVNPPWQTNDEDRHFYNAYALSQGYFSPQVGNGKVGVPMPTNLQETVRSFQGIPFRDGTQVSKKMVNNIEDQPLKEKEISFCENPNAGIFPFPYFPAAIMIKVGAVFKSSPVWIGWWGRIGSLLAYLVILFIAIKNMPHFKPLLMVVALSPMALYQGASVSYDSLNFALLFLLFSLVIQYYYQETAITLKQVLVFFLVALASRCSKEGYFLLYFSLFAIRITKFESRKVYFLAGLLLLIASFLPSYLWDSYLGSLHLPGGRFQSDFLFSLDLNIKYHLQDPLHAVSLVFQNICNQGKTWMGGSIGRFGYSYTLFPDWIVVLQLLAYISVVLFEKPARILSLKFRSVFSGFALLNFFALVGAGLFILSPVGANNMFGFQGRYLTPLLPFLFLGIFYFPVFIDREKWLKWIVPVYCILVLVYTTNFLDSKFFSV
ncbi:MAG: DUF2142 domain-containing protein [Bacteroidota bacterium]